MKFDLLNVDEFNNFVSKHQLVNFLQSPSMGKRRKDSGWNKMFLVGVRNNNKIIAAALINGKSFIGLPFFYFEICQGPIMDYDNNELVSFFFSQLKEFLKKNHAIRLRINPPLLLNHRDIESNIIKDGYSGKKYIKLFKNNGFKHLNNKKIDSDASLLRWYSSKDMSKIKSSKELLESYHPKTKWSVRKTESLGIFVKKINIDQLDEFYDVLKNTGNRKQFLVREKQYYIGLFNNFDSKNIHFCLAQINVNKYQLKMRSKLEQAKNQLDSIVSSNEQIPDDKKQKMIKVANEAIIHFETMLNKTEEMRKDGDVITLAVAVFIIYGDEMVYLSGGSNEKYLTFCAPFALQWYSQQYAIKHHIKKYNFYGTRGNFSGNPEQHGIFVYKKGFGAILEEQIGYFDLNNFSVISKLFRIIYKLLHKN